MWLWILGSVVGIWLIVASILGLALCRSAKRGDQQFREGVENENNFHSK